MKSKIKFFSIFTISLIVILNFWIPEKKYLIGGDINFFFNKKVDLLNRLNIYQPFFNTNSIFPENVPGLPLTLLRYMFGFFDINIQQILFYFVVIIVNTISVIYFINSIKRNIFYTLNIVLQIIFTIYFNFSFISAFIYTNLVDASLVISYTCFSLGLVIRYLFQFKNYSKFIAQSSLTFAVLGWTLASNFSLLQIWLVIYFVLISVLSYKKFRSFGELIKLNLTLFLLFIFSNLWWIFAISIKLKFNYLNKLSIFETYDIKDYTSSQSNFTTPYNILRFFGDQAWFTGNWPDFQFLNENNILAPFLILPLLIVLFSIFINLNAVESNLVLNILSFYFIILMFLSLGSFDGFSHLYFWLQTNFPGFFLQRSPWQKFHTFNHIFSSTLIFFALFYFQNKLDFIRSIYRILCYLILFITLAINSYLTISGSFIESKWSKKPSYNSSNNIKRLTSIPNYVWQSASLINKENEFRIENDSRVLLLPLSSISIYEWGYAAPNDILSNILNIGVLKYNYDKSLNQSNTYLLNKMMYYLENKDYLNFDLIRTQLNIKYIILRSDFNSNFITDKRPIFDVKNPIYNDITSDFYLSLRSSLPTYKKIQIEQFGKWIIIDFTKVNISKGESFSINSKEDYFFGNEIYNLGNHFLYKFSKYDSSTKFHVNPLFSNELKIISSFSSNSLCIDVIEIKNINVNIFPHCTLNKYVIVLSAYDFIFQILLIFNFIFMLYFVRRTYKI